MLYTKEQERELRKRLELCSTSSVYSSFADISISELMSAIRIAKSYKKVETKTLPDGTVQSRVSYINERDYYGMRPSLNTNAILLFIYLHFLNPTSDGLVFLTISDAAEFLNLPKKTIRCNLKYLQRRQYIIYDRNEDGLYYVHINSYSSKHFNARNGGRGYISLSYDTFFDMVHEGRAKNINELRLQVRGFISCVPGLSQDRFSNISLREMKKMFPAYVGFKDIKMMLMTDELQKFFHIGIQKGTSVISMKAKEAYDVLAVKKKTLDIAASDLKSYVDNLLKMKSFKKKKIRFSESDFLDVAKITLKYNIEDVKRAIWNLFDVYGNTEIHSIGAMVRTITSDVAGYGRLLTE